MGRGGRFVRGSCVVALLLGATARPAAAGAAAQEPPAGEVAPEVVRVRDLYLALDDAGAVAAADAWLAGHPGDGFVLELKARALRQLGRLGEAAACCEAIEPRHARIALLLAECVGLDERRLAAAEALIDQVAALAPDAIEPRLVRARLRIAHDRLDEARADLALVRAQRPRHYLAQLLLALAAEREGPAQRALAEYQPLLEQRAQWERTDPHHEAEAAAGAARCLLRLRRTAAARDLCAQLLERFDGSAALHALHAAANGLLEQTGPAIASLERAVALAPDVVEYRIQLAGLLGRSGRKDEALAHYRAAVERAAQQAARRLPAEIGLAELLIERGELDAAQPHVEAALSIAPEAPEARLAAARLQEKRGARERAIEEYRAALRADPLLLDAAYRLAMLLARAKDEAARAESRELLARHHRMEPQIAEIARTRRQLELAPGDPELLSWLAELLDAGGEHALAREQAQRAVDAAPASARAHARLGCACANGGDREAALAHLRRALELRPAPSEAVPAGVDFDAVAGWVALLAAGKELALPIGVAPRAGER